MAHIIAASSLKSVRANPASLLGDWFDGRCSALAIMYYEPEILAAVNEIRFLTGDYRMRHFGESA
jgi:hypothetical protein